MGGEGSMANMIASLRFNKNQLRRKRLFKKERSFLNLKKEYFKAANGEKNLRNATPSELRKIREKVLAHRKYENRIQFVVAFVFIFVIGILTFKYYRYYKKESQEYNRAIESVQFEKKLKKYLFFISDGDKWIGENHWNNAIFQYKEAIKVFPAEFDANYRLAVAYSYTCKYEHTHCEEGIILTAKLKKQFPDKPKILELETVFPQN